MAFAPNIDEDYKQNIRTIVYEMMSEWLRTMPATVKAIIEIATVTDGAGNVQVFCPMLTPYSLETDVDAWRTAVPGNRMFSNLIPEIGDVVDVRYNLNDDQLYYFTHHYADQPPINTGVGLKVLFEHAIPPARLSFSTTTLKWDLESAEKLGKIMDDLITFISSVLNELKVFTVITTTASNPTTPDPAAVAAVTALGVSLTAIKVRFAALLEQ